MNLCYHENTIEREQALLKLKGKLNIVERSKKEAKIDSIVEMYN